jgi:FtsZ-binding cell division protein ZapB
MRSPHANAAKCANRRARLRDQCFDTKMQLYQHLMADVDTLSKEVQRLKEQNDTIVEQNHRLIEQCDTLIKQNQQLKEFVVGLAKSDTVIEQNQRHRQSATPAEPRARVEDITPSILPLVSKKPKTPPIVPPIEFEAWWAGWPNKVDKKAAMAEYARARRKVSAETLKAGVQRYIDTKPAEWQWCGPARWLRNERWNDQPAVQPQPTRTYAQQSYGGLI